MTTLVSSRMRITHTASVMFFTLSVLPSVHIGWGVGGGGGPGTCTIWLMSQGLSTFWLKSAHVWRGGGNIPECLACCLYKHHALLLACYQSAHLLSKGCHKACTCLYSQATRHSGILHTHPPPPSRA